MGSFGAPVNFGSSGLHSTAQASDKDTQLQGSSPGKRSKGQHSSASGAAGCAQQHPGESWTRSSIHDQQFVAGQGSSFASRQQPGTIPSAFAELDSNQDPLQRARFPAAAGKDSSSMGDQAKQQPSAPVFGGFPAPEANASWASLMSGISQNYSSPGAKAAGRRLGTRKGATPKASRMQQRPAAAPAAAGHTSATLGQGSGTAAFGSPAGPMFAFGSPMQPADSAAAGAAAGAAATAGPAHAAGPTPVPSTLPPGTAMSTDTARGATFTAAFSAMSIDATPAAFGSSTGQEPWAFRGARAASLTGKRLFDTPSSAGADSSSPNPFASWGAASGADGSAGRAGADPVPFPGFGGAAPDSAAGSSSPGFAFNPGKASPRPGRGRGRQHRSPAQKPPAAPAFGGFGSPAFAPKPPAAPAAGGSASSTPAPAPFAAGSSSATPSVASGGSFQGFFGGAQPPGSAASTPGFSPMLWSPVDNKAQDTTAAAAAAAAAAGGAASAGAPAAGFAAAVSIQQPQPQAQAPTAADTMAAAAVDLPSDDSTEATIIQLPSQPSASGSRPAAAAAAGQPAEPTAIAGLRHAVEQLSTSEQVPAQQQQQQPAVPSFVFGSPEAVAAMGRTDSTWLSSPGDVGAVPTTLFDMSPLKTALDGTSTGQQAGGSASAAASTAPQPAFAGAGAGAPAAFTVSAAAGAAGSAAGGVGGIAGASAGAVPSFSTGAFSPVPGKGSKAAAGGSGKHAAKGKKATPAKPHRHAAGAAAAAGTAAAAPQVSFGFPAGGSGSSAAASAAGQPNGFFGQPQQQRPQQQQQHQQHEQQSGEGVSYRKHPTAWAATTAGDASDSSSADHADTFSVQQQQHQMHQQAADSRTPGRRKLHATPRRAHRRDGAQQPAVQQQQQQPQQPAASIQKQWQAAAANAAPNLSFTVGSSKGAAAGPSAKSPRKARAAPQQQQQQPLNGAAQQAAAVDEAVRQAKVWEQRAQMSHANHSWLQADGELAQGIAILQSFQEHPKAADGLCWLLAARASARIGADDPEAALAFGLQAIKVRPKSIEARLRAATCLCKLGCLAAADRLLDKAMDMLSAGHQDWARLRKKQQQAHQLEQQQQRVVAAALGCDPAAAAAALAALSAGLPVQQHLEGAVSVAPRPTAAAAAAALVDAGTSPLQDAAAAQELIEAADKLTSELAFWEDSTALKAWLQLRSGQLAAAAQTAESQPNKYLAKKPHHSSSEWGWRWWVLAQVKWQQGDLAAAKALLQQGQGMLQNASQGSSDGSSSSSTCLWLLLLPSTEELLELLQQVQQLLALKEAGNAAVQAKQYEKAAEEYTKALALQPSCGFAAVIHSNRAAALQQQQRLIEALADCSRAVALDPKYGRAYLRMAQVLEALHRADRAVVVLQDALKGAANAVDPATTRGHELTHGAAVLQLSSTDRRKFEDMLATAQVAARRFKTPHHYKALGLAMGATEADIRKAYRGLALKHHPDKALQHCRWSAKLGKCGAAAAHVTAASGGVEASLKAAANEVFGFLSAAQEELTSATSRSKLDRDLRTEEQLYSNNGSCSYSRPASYTYSYGGRRADADYGFDDFFRRTAAAGSGGSRPAQATARQQASGSGSGRAAGGSGGASRPAGAAAGQRWYENSYWESAEADVESEDEDDDYDYGYGGTGFHYRSRY